MSESIISADKAPGNRPERNEKGQLLPGHSVRSPGRPKRDDRQLIAEMAERYPAASVVDLFDEALTEARSGRAAVANSILAIAKTMYEYRVGKPATRSLVLHGDLDDKLKQWLTGAGDQPDD